MSENKSRPAEELRVAAALLRAAAAKATEGPWEWQNYPDTHDLVHPTGTAEGPSHPRNVLKCPTEHWPPNAADAHWIALMSPIVAGPLASWLEYEARYWDHFGAATEDFTTALDFARAVTKAATL